MLAIKTLWLVNTEHLAAFWAYPPFFFVSYEMSYAEIFYALKICDHAHAVLGSITPIQIPQPDAGEAFTTKAVIGFGVYYLLTVLDFACDAGFRF
jgi:hypothetical protein